MGFPSRTMRRRWIPCTDAASRRRPSAPTAACRASGPAMNVGGRIATPVSCAEPLTARSMAAWEAARPAGVSRAGARIARYALAAPAGRSTATCWSSAACSSPMVANRPPGVGSTATPAWLARAASMSASADSDSTSASVTVIPSARSLAASISERVSRSAAESACGAWPVPSPSSSSTAVWAPSACAALGDAGCAIGLWRRRRPSAALLRTIPMAAGSSLSRSSGSWRRTATSPPRSAGKRAVALVNARATMG